MGPHFVCPRVCFPPPPPRNWALVCRAARDKEVRARLPPLFSPPPPLTDRIEKERGAHALSSLPPFFCDSRFHSLNIGLEEYEGSGPSSHTLFFLSSLSFLSSPLLFYDKKCGGGERDFSLPSLRNSLVACGPSNERNGPPFFFFLLSILLRRGRKKKDIAATPSFPPPPLSFGMRAVTWCL